MPPIITYLIEEHNEALLCWEWARRQGRLADRAHAVLHFDDHSDMNPCHFNTPFRTVIADRDWERVTDFIYREVGYASFLVPAIHAGLIDSVSWLKTDMERAQSFRIQTWEELDGCQLLYAKEPIGVAPEIVRMRAFDYHRLAAHDLRSTDHIGDREVLLDFDLDYFSCNIHPTGSNNVVVDVTAEEYAEFNADPYHPMRMLHRVEARRVDDRFYYIINRTDAVLPSARRVEPAVIESRVDAVIDALRRLSITPRLITICRSRHSGYTPVDQWAFIEQRLLAGLRSLYPLEISTVPVAPTVPEYQ